MAWEASWCKRSLPELSLCLFFHSPGCIWAPPLLSCQSGSHIWDPSGSQTACTSCRSNPAVRFLCAFLFSNSVIWRAARLLFTRRGQEWTWREKDPNNTELFSWLLEMPSSSIMSLDTGKYSVGVYFLWKEATLNFPSHFFSLSFQMLWGILSFITALPSQTWLQMPRRGPHTPFVPLAPVRLLEPAVSTAIRFP